MTTIKSYTDIEQSKKLVKILPFDSADMFYVFESINGELHYHPIIITKHTNRNFIISEYNSGRGIVSWSLAALLAILLNYQLQTQDDGIGILCSCNGEFNIVTANNPIDACYEMILKLHELKML